MRISISAITVLISQCTRHTIASSFKLNFSMENQRMIAEFSISVIFQTQSVLKEACNLKSLIFTVFIALDYVLTWPQQVFLFDLVLFFFLNKELERTRRVLNADGCFMIPVLTLSMLIFSLISSRFLSLRRLFFMKVLVSD